MLGIIVAALAGIVLGAAYTYALPRRGKPRGRIVLTSLVAVLIGGYWAISRIGGTNAGYAFFLGMIASSAVGFLAPVPRIRSRRQDPGDNEIATMSDPLPPMRSIDPDAVRDQGGGRDRVAATIIWVVIAAAAASAWFIGDVVFPGEVPPVWWFGLWFLPVLAVGLVLARRDRRRRRSTTEPKRGRQG
jgi:hypothetical protein